MRTRKSTKSSSSETSILFPILLRKPRDRLHKTPSIDGGSRLPLPKLPKLPKGEGWGEGEKDWRLPRIVVHAADLAVWFAIMLLTGSPSIASDRAFNRYVLDFTTTTDT